jgi:hypothetical protein
MTQITHTQTAEIQAFRKVHEDLKKCFITWEEGGIAPNLALWATVALVTETLMNALGDRGRVAEFMLAAMNSSLSDSKEGMN